jgi:transaldolase/glucose-6-phosphate isomerase
MSKSPLLGARDLGQSIWLDQLSRSLIMSGGLKRLIDEDGLRGVTTNPSIFHEAITGGDDYDGAVAALAEQGREVQEIYQSLTVGDVQLAADELRALHDSSGGDHGFVSLEVNPHLAYETEATIEEARRLWRAVDRPNIFIKVPATEPGLTAIRTLIGEGINVNVTLLFGLPRYHRVAEAYLSGLEDLAAAGQPIDRVRSVASFFLSRIDVLVDPQLAALAEAGGREAGLARSLHGEVAIACARLAYRIYKDVFGGKRFTSLAARGARPQRVLWASTSTKNPDYSDVKYVEPLIGPETVNTMPLKTIDAFRDHGRPAARLEDDVEKAEAVLARLPEVGLDIDEVSRELEKEGVEKFNRPYDTLLATLTERSLADRQAAPPAQEIAAGGLAAPCEERLIDLQDREFCARLGRRDPSLWSEDPQRQRQIAGGLGWLAAPALMTDHLTELLRFAREIRAAGFRHVVHMGMGGSSLAPLVLQRTFVGQPSAAAVDGLELTVLDTTDPTAVDRLSRQAPPAQTLFIVASKSGTTTEPLDFAAYFYERVRSARGERAGESFVAITDPGTPLVEQARRLGYRRTFLNFEDIGGRYSALTWFGLVPAVLAGVDVATLLARALAMKRACGICTPLHDNPGIALGAALGELALRGRDKITFVAPAEIATFAMWLEQLLAESTGKEGRGLLPVAGEPVGPPEVYGDDRVFVHLRWDRQRGQGAAEPADETAAAIERLARAGQPVITVRLRDPLDLGAEFVRWEVATATAGAVLGIDPFDQPNVQESKDNTKRLLAQVKQEGGLPREEPDLQTQGLQLFGASRASSLEEAVGAFLSQARSGDYVALLAYLAPDPETDAVLDEIRLAARRRLRVATTAGYGPRYLHSTGQLHKGGPASGLYVMLTAAEQPELAVPGREYTFGTLQLAQAIGDLRALREHGRRVLRIHLGSDARGGLQKLRKALPRALEASA